MKFSTPSETRVTPISLSIFTFSRLSVPGSHSKVTSSAVCHERYSLNRSCSERSCLAAQIGRRAAAEIGEAERAPLHAGLLAQQLELFLESLDVILDRLGILVRVDAKITEPATLPAEGNVDVEAHRDRTIGRRGECPTNLRNVQAVPERKRGIVGDEVAANLGRRLCDHKTSRVA